MLLPKGAAGISFRKPGTQLIRNLVVKLFYSDGTPIPNASVTVSTTGKPTNQFAYATLATPATLAAGTTYAVMSEEVNGGDQWYNFSGTSITLSGAASGAWAVYAPPYSGVPGGSGQSYGPVNLKAWAGISGWGPASETRYLYDGRLVLQERDANNLPTVTYTRRLDLSGTREGAGGIGGLLARTDHGSGQSAFYHADGNGNVTALVNAQQLVVARYTYDPFGNTLSKSGPLADANLYRFSSKESHEPSGLVYYLYRFYDPNLQRWINRDPIEEAGGINLYGFLYNDPLNWIDPLGLEGSVDFKARAQCLCKCGWLKCDTARKLGERALEEARKRFPSDDSLHNGPGDAWRHCYWSCMMGDVIGKRCARIIGNAYEDSGDRHGQPPDEREMDDHNNRVGRSLAGKPGSCKDLCQKALDDGKLKVLR